MILRPGFLLIPYAAVVATATPATGAGQAILNEDGTGLFNEDGTTAITNEA